MMQFSLREFANIPEAMMLRWRGYRCPVTVVDDEGVSVESDTYVLMLTWLGLIIHRHYNHIPYSVKELIPSNKVAGSTDKMITYDDDVQAIPINYMLAKLLPTIKSLAEIDDIKRLIHIWQNKLHNQSVVMGEGSSLSASAESVGDLMSDEGVMDIRDQILNKEISIDEGEDKFNHHIKAAESLDRNVMAMLARTGGVSVNQAYQLSVMRGGVFSLNNTIHPNAVSVPYAHGITNLADSLGEKNASGKATVLTAKVKVPGGWKLMGAMLEGDTVVTPDGKTASVTGVFPQGVTKVLRVHFKDGRFVDVNPEHLWNVRRHQWCNHTTAKTLTKEEIEDKVWRTITTEELKGYIGLGTKTYIQLAKSEENEDKFFELDPYVLGVLLGDGHIAHRQVTITKPYQQLFDKVEALLPKHLKCNWNSEKTFSIIYRKTEDRRSYTHVRQELQRLGLAEKRSWDKYIPECYLHGSTTQRLELLRGLLDTDGTVGKNKDVSFSSSSKLLALGVQYLVRSLGGMASMSTRVPHYAYKGERKEGRIDYRIFIRYPRPEELFSLDHKRDRAVAGQHTNTLRLQVTKIEERPDELTQCISIDSPEHLYVTDDFIVTHNSLTNNGKALKDSELFHRKTHILTAVVRGMNFGWDCGTKVCVPIKIANMNVAMGLRGKWQQMPAGNLQLIDNDNVWEIKVGDTVWIRSVAFCNSRDAGVPCGTCYGMMATSVPFNQMMDKIANVGMWSATSICNPMGQGMLSTKHFIRNAITRQFVPHRRDTNIISSNGDEIFLNPEVIEPGCDMVLGAEIVNVLSDIRSLGDLNAVSLEKLPYFAEVTFRYAVEDIMMGGKTIQQHAAHTSISSRKARFSLEFLRYVLDHGWETLGKKHVKIDLAHWNVMEPVFSLPFIREDLDAHRARVESFITFSKRNSTWKNQVVTPKVFGEVLTEYWTLIAQEIKGINVVHPEIMLYCCLTATPGGIDASIPTGDVPKYFSSFEEAVIGRGIGHLMIYERQQNVLNKMKTFRMVNRQGSPLEAFFALGVG